MSRHETISEFIKKNALPITVQIVGLFVFLINLWLVTKLAPIIQSVSVLEQRVSAVESDVKDDIGRSEFTQVLKQLDYISNQVDKLIFERRGQ